jgi:hypothetical protein
MTKEDIIRMAREAGAIHIHGKPKEFAIVGNDSIKAFATLVAAAERNRTWTQEHWTEYEHSIAAVEREACAKVCDKYSATGEFNDFDRGWLACAKNAAVAIRARGQA